MEVEPNLYHKIAPSGCISISDKWSELENVYFQMKLSRQDIFFNIIRKKFYDLLKKWLGNCITKYPLLNIDKIQLFNAIDIIVKYAILQMPLAHLEKVMLFIFENCPIEKTLFVAATFKDDSHVKKLMKIISEKVVSLQSIELDYMFKVLKENEKDLFLTAFLVTLLYNSKLISWNYTAIQLDVEFQLLEENFRANQEEVPDFFQAVLKFKYHSILEKVLWNSFSKLPSLEFHTLHLWNSIKSILKRFIVHVLVPDLEMVLYFILQKCHHNGIVKASYADPDHIQTMIAIFRHRHCYLGLPQDNIVLNVLETTTRNHMPQFPF